MRDNALTLTMLKFIPCISFILLLLTGCMIDFGQMVNADKMATRSNAYETIAKSGGTLCQQLGQRAIIDVNRCTTIGCEGHLAGAEWAQQVLNKTGGWPNTCAGKSRSFTEGCQAYVFGTVDPICRSPNAYIVK